MKRNENNEMIVDRPDYLALARAQYGRDGEIEFDPHAVVSIDEDAAPGTEEGAYVQAWVWVDNPAKAKIDEPSLDDRRRMAADNAFENYDFVRQVEAVGGWESITPGNSWWRTVYLLPEPDEDSDETPPTEARTFEVRFKPGTAEIESAE